MTVERIVRIVAGFFIMLSLALAHFSGTVDMSQLSWLWFTAFVGINLFQSGFTRFCPIEIILKKAGVKEGGSCCS
jgi:cytochrome c biogenesis protein CcdA